MATSASRTTPPAAEAAPPDHIARARLLRAQAFRATVRQLLAGHTYSAEFLIR